ncbi:PST1 [Hepatospora eriocheir]|uniref:PST1 n=1 Tax=Hepatospora eriocheir TaxID=1081669 RepID=A0A1X0QGP4_9MICR|nr:PST1 [Hepatospora eriocheir]
MKPNNIKFAYQSTQKYRQQQPQPWVTSFPAKRDISKTAPVSKQFEFIEEFKLRYSPNDPTYGKVIDIMTNPHISKKDVLVRVEDVLKNDRETFEIFKRICMPEYKDYEPPKKIKLSNKPLDKIMDIMKEKKLEDQFLKLVNLLNQRLISSKVFFPLMEKIINDDELMRELKRYLHYSEVDVGTNKSVLTQKKVGSYIEYPKKNENVECPSMFKTILNDRFVNVSTYNSEDSGYVFRFKNQSETILNKLSDDRSDIDVTIARVKYFILKLTKVYDLATNHNEKKLEISDFEFSEQVLIETMRMIYGEDYQKILDKMLELPLAAIPKVIERGYKVFKEFSTKQRENQEYWRYVTETHYYKAYDTNGVEYKSQEKNCLNLRYIQNNCNTPITISIEDTEIFNFVRDLFSTFITNNYNNNKKISIQSKEEYFFKCIDLLDEQGVDENIGFEHYALYVYFLKICSRFEEVFKYDISIEKPNRVALNLGLVEEPAYETMKEGIIDLSEKLVSKEIDSDTFESQIRILTNMKGFKLYNLKKMISKMDRLVGIILERELDSSTSNISFNVNRTDNVITLSKNEKAAELTIDDNEMVESEV